MKLESKYFDSIRIKPRQERTAREEERRCQWKGCGAAGKHRAPKGRGRDGQYFLFCADHVRKYNSSYNYFDGMSDDDVASFQKDALTGHRPTWKVDGSGPMPGMDAQSPNAGSSAKTKGARAAMNDPHGVLGGASGQDRNADGKRRRPLRKLERKSLKALHLDDDASKVDIKARFKELVKQNHPDLNGGDRSSEDKLREIIQAYNYLKQAGLV
jgi:curved DNA-binding protein CbpA